MFSNTEDYWLSIPEHIRPHKDQPFYHLLAENDESAYVAYVSEQNLLPDDTRPAGGPPAGRADLRDLRRGPVSPAPRDRPLDAASAHGISGNRPFLSRLRTELPRERRHSARHEHDDYPERPAAGRAADWTIDQGWAATPRPSTQVWITLYERQTALLPGRACDAFLQGLDALDLHRAASRISPASTRSWTRLTGWTVVARARPGPRRGVLRSSGQPPIPRRPVHPPARPARLSAGT